MTWTREKPTEPGWYWLRGVHFDQCGYDAYDVEAGEGDDLNCGFVTTLDGALIFCFGCGHVHLAHIPSSAEWQGPIRPEEAADGATDA